MHFQTVRIHIKCAYVGSQKKFKTGTKTKNKVIQIKKQQFKRGFSHTENVQTVSHVYWFLLLHSVIYHDIQTRAVCN